MAKLECYKKYNSVHKNKCNYCSVKLMCMYYTIQSISKEIDIVSKESKKIVVIASKTIMVLNG